MAAYPKITNRGFFEKSEWFVLPESLIILKQGLGSDRIQRIQYAEISDIAAGKVFPVLHFILALLFVVLSGWIMVGTDFNPIASICFPALVIVFSQVVLRKKSVFVVRSLGGVFKTSEVCLSQKKMDNFVNVLIANTIAAQTNRPDQASATEAYFQSAPGSAEALPPYG